jgi:hypothetical protein
MVDARAAALGRRAEAVEQYESMRAWGLLLCAVLLGALAGYSASGSLQLVAATASASALLLATVPR